MAYVMHLVQSHTVLFQWLPVVFCMLC